jgi:hypothetical protein
MYAINVFITFSLSMYAMCRYWWRRRGRNPEWRQRLTLFGLGFALCITILGVTIYEKFLLGGWVTVAITLVVIGACLLIRRHYRSAEARVNQLYQELGDLPRRHDGRGAELGEPMPEDRVAAILVERYGGVGIHTVLNVLRMFPDHFRGLVFLSVGVIDSGEFKGGHAVEHLQQQTSELLAQYRSLAAELGLPSTSRMEIGTEVVESAEVLCLRVAGEFPKATFFAGQLIFQQPRWWHGILHSGTARAIQERLQWAGRAMVTLPIRVREAG